MQEIDYLLDTNQLGVVVHEDGAAAMNNIREWLATPMGDVYGMPSWGNEFYLYRHLPIDDLIEVLIEGHIITKLPDDIPSITISGIRVVAKSIDEITVSIASNIGAISEVLISL